LTWFLGRRADDDGPGPVQDLDAADRLRVTAKQNAIHERLDPLDVLFSNLGREGCRRRPADLLERIATAVRRESGAVDSHR